MLPALLVLQAADGYVEIAIRPIHHVNLTIQTGATGHTNLWSQVARVDSYKASILHCSRYRGQDREEFAQKRESPDVRVNQGRGTSH